MFKINSVPGLSRFSLCLEEEGIGFHLLAILTRSCFRFADIKDVIHDAFPYMSLMLYHFQGTCI